MINQNISKSFQNSSILVTGGGGFIGSHLVEELINIQSQVTILDPLPYGLPNNLQAHASSINIIESDLLSQLNNNTLSLNKYDWIFHLAGNNTVSKSVSNPELDFDTNLITTFKLLETMRNKAPDVGLINISSAAVYGNPITMPIKETDPTMPLSPYGVSKLAAERYISVYSTLYGISAATLRVFSAYGPRQNKLVIYDLMKKILKKTPTLSVLGDGTQARDFIYISDIINALLLIAATAPCQGEVYNVASGTSVRISELVELLCKTCNWYPKIEFTGKSRPGDPEKWYVDTNHLEALGFKPLTSLEKGLELTRKWYESSFN